MLQKHLNFRHLLILLPDLYVRLVLKVWDQHTLDILISQCSMVRESKLSH